MLSLKAVGRNLVLTQLIVPDFIDSSWEPLPIGKNKWGMGWGEGEGGQEEG